MKTWGRAGLKPEEAIAKLALAPKSYKSPIEYHYRVDQAGRTTFALVAGWLLGARGGGEPSYVELGSHCFQGEPLTT